LKLRSLSFRSRYVLAVGAAVFLVSVSILFSDSLQDMITGATGQISVASVGSISGALTGSIVGTINSLSYFGVFGLMLLEATSLPVPSEVVLPFAGYLVSVGRLEFWLTVALATLAGVLGALIDYYIGRFLGTKAVSNYGSRFFISKEQMKKMELLFGKHGARIVFASRLIPGVRTLISFPAGSARMGLAKFTFYTVLGCFGFNALLVYAGDYLGSHWSAIRALGVFELAGTVIVLACSLWLFLRIQGRQTAKAAPAGPTEL
jgi:membrane protein DedA with SNARE-associated domain